MAEAPPRRESLSSQGNIQSTKQRSTLETLLSMGFSRKRAEKAIAATGNKDVNLASEWLVSHAHDPTIDEGQPRQYVFYLCPTGEFLAQLIQFWQTSKSLGWNSAHIYHPHITLCPFFTIPDDKVSVIDSVITMVTSIIQEWYSLDHSIGLDLDTKNNSFIGYFVSRPIHQLIEDLMIRVQMELTKNGVEVNLHQKQLHLTLAFQYNVESQDKLMELAQAIQMPETVTWDVRVYSRNSSLRTHEVHRILKYYQPEQGDELELCVDDYVLMDPQEYEKSLDGWYKGSSHLTGAVGFFPGNFTEQCSQMDTWTLHRTVEFVSRTRNVTNGLYPDLDNHVHEQDETKQAAAPSDNSKSDFDNLWMVLPVDMYATVNKTSKLRSQLPQMAPLKELADPQKLFVMRHAQRCDFNYKNWFQQSFNDQGVYSRFDLNCPPSVWPRKLFTDYSQDCPLTEIGKAQALITGEGLKAAGVTIAFIYASPSLRCVQTAHQMLKGLDSAALICIEAGLFEWCGWCRAGMPCFMTTDELTNVGFPIDHSYVPFMRTSQLDHRESVEAYYNRSFHTTQHVVRRHSVHRGKILLVGHSGTMDACTRQLRGKPAITTDIQLRDVVRGCPYCFMCTAVEDPKTHTWDLCEPPIVPLTHGPNKEYDWKSMI